MLELQFHVVTLARDDVLDGLRVSLFLTSFQRLFQLFLYAHEPRFSSTRTHRMNEILRNITQKVQSPRCCYVKSAGEDVALERMENDRRRLSSSFIRRRALPREAILPQGKDIPTFRWRCRARLFVGRLVPFRVRNGVSNATAHVRGLSL